MIVEVFVASFRGPTHSTNAFKNAVPSNWNFVQLLVSIRDQEVWSNRKSNAQIPVASEGNILHR